MTVTVQSVLDRVQQALEDLTPTRLAVVRDAAKKNTKCKSATVLIGV